MNETPSVEATTVVPSAARMRKYAVYSASRSRPKTAAETAPVPSSAATADTAVPPSAAGTKSARTVKSLASVEKAASSAAVPAPVPSGASTAGAGSARVVNVAFVETAVPPIVAESVAV